MKRKTPANNADAAFKYITQKIFKIFYENILIGNSLHKITFFYNFVSS